MELAGQLLQFFFSGVTNGSIFALVAIGFSIIYRTTQVINFAQGEFVTFGALLMYTGYATLGLPIPIAFVLAVLGAMLVGILLERLAINPVFVRGGSVVVMIMITLGASIFLRGAALLLWGKDFVPLPPFGKEVTVKWLGAAISSQALWVVGMAAALVLAITGLFRFTMVGWAMRACALNRDMAALVGINVRLYVMLAFALSAILGGAGGIVMGPITMAHFNLGSALVLKGFTAAVVGGMGSVAGATLGGFLIGLVDAYAAGLIGSGYRDAVTFGLLLLVLFVRPSGLVGEFQAERI